MEKIEKTLIAATLLLIPTYLIKFTIFNIPTNVLEIFVLVNFVSYYLKRSSASLDQNGPKRPNLGMSEFYKNNKIISWSVAAIFTGLLLSTLLNDNWRAGFGVIKGWFVIPVLFSWLVYKSVKSEQDLKSVLTWLYSGIFGVSVTALGYYFAGILTYDGRLSGIYNSPNFLAMYASPAIIIGIFLIKNAMRNVQNYSSKFKILLLIISLVIILCVCYLTYSYAAWAAVMLGLIITALMKNKKINRRAILVGLIIILLIIISQWNTEKYGNLREFTRSSMESRIMIWKSAGKILADNPVWGIGPGNFQSKYLEHQKYFPPYLEWAVPEPHNLYLAFWLHAGLPGIIGFLILIIKWLKDLSKNIKKQKNSEISAVLLGIMLYILIHGLVDTPYWKNDLSLVFWLIFFLGLRLNFNAINLSVDPVYEKEDSFRRREKNI